MTISVRDRVAINNALDEAAALLERLATLPDTSETRYMELRKVHAEIVFLLVDKTKGTFIRAGHEAIYLPIIDWRRSHLEIRKALTQFLHGFREQLEQLVRAS